MPLYLLDTNIASFFVRKRLPSLQENMIRNGGKNFAISVVTEAELRFGIARHPQIAIREDILDFLDLIEILPWDSPAARVYAKLRAELESVGKPLDNIDLMIASHAVALGAMLITNDRAFSRIRNLKIEDWTQARR